MARLLDAFEQELSTDFAILTVGQQDLRDGTGRPIFAVSIPGAVGLTAGTRYADMQVRMERWDAMPPEPEGSWEDRDEVPWLTVAGAGDLKASEFDPAPPGPGLSLDGLTTGRAQVFAAGRYRYDYSDMHEEGFWPPERWLVRIWPTDHPGDGLSGPPRRLGGPSIFGTEQLTEWHAALRGWDEAGWLHLFRPVGAFRVISQGLSIVGRPCKQDELEAHLYGTLDDRPTWQSPIFGRPLIPGLEDHVQPRLAVIAQVAGVGEIRTYGDALTCLERLGLLLRESDSEDARLTINPAVSPVTDRVDLGPDFSRAVQVEQLRTRYQQFEEDLLHLVRWAPNHVLRTSPGQVVRRLGLTTAQVIGTLRYLALQGQIQVAGAMDGIDSELEIRTAPSAQR